MLASLCFLFPSHTIIKLAERYTFSYVTFAHFLSIVSLLFSFLSRVRTASSFRWVILKEDYQGSNFFLMIFVAFFSLLALYPPSHVSLPLREVNSVFYLKGKLKRDFFVLMVNSIYTFATH